MSVIAPSELLQASELQDQFVQSWRMHLPLDRLLAAADMIVEQDDPVAFLDDLNDQDMDAWYAAKRVITTLPPKTIFDNYGTEMLAWAAANCVTAETGEAMSRGLAEYAGFDRGLFKRAKQWEWQHSINSKGKRVLAQYRWMDSVSGGVLEEVDLSSILRESARPGIELSEKRQADYSLIPLLPNRSDAGADGPADGWYGAAPGMIDYNIWLDAPVGFALAYKGKPNAVASLAHINLDEVMMYQIQGVQAKRVNPNLRTASDGEYYTDTFGSRGLPPLDWRKVLVRITQNIAQANDIERIGIQAADNNKWTKIQPRDTEPHMSLEAAKEAYDTTAQRLGFTKQEDGNWHRPV